MIVDELKRQTLEGLEKVYENRFVPMVFACDDDSIPYAAVCIKSIIKNINNGYNLDIIVVCNELSPKNQNMLLKFQSDKISIRTYSLNIAESPHIFGNFFEMACFYIPEIMKNYDKIIYLGSDIVANDDISKLYENINFSHEIIAAARDIDAICQYSQNTSMALNVTFKEYWNNVLKLQNPNNYCDTRVIVFNIQEFLKQDFLGKFFQNKREVLSSFGSFQDIFNVIFCDKLKIIDNGWNFPEEVKENFEQFLSKELIQEYFKARTDPKLVHYTDKTKLWKSSNLVFLELWWCYAKQTPFYEVILNEILIDAKEPLWNMPEFIFKKNEDSECVHYDIVANQRRMNLVYVCDKNSVKKCAVSMLSLLSNKNEQDFINFYFIADESFEMENLKYLDFFNTNSSSMQILKVNSWEFYLYKSTTQRTLLPINAYYYLHIAWMLKEEDRVLYLDYDTIVCSSLWEVYNLDIKGYYLAAVDDSWKYGRYKQMMHLQSESRHYNSGVVLINCEKWRNENIKRKFEKFCYENEKQLVLADQFLINCVINKNVLYLGLEYNLQICPKSFGGKVEFDDLNEFSKAILNPKIIHYTFGKPWQIDFCQNPYFHVWWEFARKLPFYQDILQDALDEKNQKGTVGAVLRIKNQLSYRLGNTILQGIKSPLGLLKLPLNIYKTYSSYKTYIRNNKASQALEFYQDYEEALKLYNHLSYRLGKTILETRSFGKVLTFPQRLYEEIKQFRHSKTCKKQKLNQKSIYTLEDDELFFVKRHQNIFGYIPNFKNPGTFNEKIIHRILYDRNHIYTVLADKLKVRLYVYEKCRNEHLNFDFFADNSYIFKSIEELRKELFETNACEKLPKLYGIYKSIYDIDFFKLPSSFVLKTNHDSGGVVIVENKREFLKDTKRFAQAITKLKYHLNRNYFDFAREWHYLNIEPMIFAEELLIGDNNKPVDTYKFHIFDKKNVSNNYIQVTTDRFDNYQRAIFDHSWNLAPFGISYDNSKITKIPKKPIKLDEMFYFCFNLASYFDYVRVDLYQKGEKIYFGELTFTPGAAGEKIIPNEWDRKLGNLWNLKEITDVGK